VLCRAFYLSSDNSLSYKNVCLDFIKVSVYSLVKLVQAGREAPQGKTEPNGAAKGSGRQRGSRDKERAT
jgi:hypothetical protein